MDSKILEYCNLVVDSEENTKFKMMDIWVENPDADFDEVNEYLKSRMGKKFHPIFRRKAAYLKKYKSAIEDYNSGYSIRKVCDKYSIPKTSFQSYLWYKGCLRNQSEATLNYISNNYEDRFKNIGREYWYSFDSKIIKFDSAYELAYFQQIKNDCKYLHREPIKIEYRDSENRHRIYKPDFGLVTNSGEVKVVEVKSSYTYSNWKSNNDLKFEAATKFCLKRGWKFEVITEKDINWSEFPCWSDPNIIYQLEEKEDESKLQIIGRKSDKNVVLREEEVHNYTHFVTKIKNSEYTWDCHPRARLEVTYKDIMDYIGSFPPRSLKINDLYRHFNMSRNMLIVRIKEGAEDFSKDIAVWELLYLNSEDKTKPKFMKLKYKLQKMNLVDFGLLSYEEIKKALQDMNVPVWTGDIYSLIGMNQNRARLYFSEVLGIDIYEALKEINSNYTISDFRLRFRSGLPGKSKLLLEQWDSSS